MRPWSLPFQTLNVALLIALGTGMSGCSRGKSTRAVAVPEIRQVLRQRLDSSRSSIVDRDDDGARAWKDVRWFYERRHEEPVWLAGARGRRQAAELAVLVGQADLEGLEPTEYDVGQAADVVTGHASRGPAAGAPREPAVAAEAAEAELRLSYVFMKYARHLAAGRLDPHELDRNWVGEVKAADLPDVLQAATSAKGIRAALDELKPRHPQYGLLKQALARYREIAAQGGWPTTLRSDPQLRKGASSAQVPILRARLRATGDLAEAALFARLGRLFRSPDVFDDSLAKGVVRFEERNGLEADGALDAQTLADLNEPVGERIRQIELNLERLRWLPRELGPRYLLVNIPAFELQGFEDGRRTIEMRVAAGTREHPTPIFSERMTTVVFSPYWNIPPRIAREEWIPEVVRDPEYLRQNGLEIVKGDRVLDPREVSWSDTDLRLRQRPGAANLLGLVVFKFPNPFDVYIHDTPFDSEFHRAARGLSHGCVRIEKPEELAEWVLRGQEGWTRGRIEAAMHGGVEVPVRLERPLPVYLVYQTAWARPDGAVRFSTDAYGHDEAQLALLARAAGTTVVRRGRAAEPELTSRASSRRPSPRGSRPAGP